jgi:hypothetical protein
MTTQQRAYSSTVVSPWLAVASVVMGAALGAVPQHWRVHPHQHA